MIIIGDVHGCIKTLEKLLSKIYNLYSKNEKICYVGDVIDRGPNSKAVIERILEDGSDCVLGNHEDMFLYQRRFSNLNGGIQTLKSYGVEYSSDIPETHQNWMRSLPLFNTYEVEGFSQKILVSHSFVPHPNPSALDATGRDFRHEFLWNRRGTPQKFPNTFHVFGHTPRYKPEKTNYYANIDTGCCFGNSLTALHFPSLSFVQENFCD